MADAKESSSKRSDAKGDFTDADLKNAKRAGENEDDEDSMLLDGAKAPPRRASVGWETESSTFTSDEKAIGATAAGNTVANEMKRGGRRRKGSEGTMGPATGADKAKQKNRHFDDDGDSNDIVEIPDLEEEEREPDITTQVAEAPRNAARAVQSLKELEKDIKFALPSASTFGMDLHLLTSSLCPEKAVGEPDDLWDFDGLLNEVSQELQKDLDDKEELLKAEGA